jgi:ribosomal protein L29
MADAKKTTTAKSPKAAVEVKTVAQLNEDLQALQQEHLDSRKSHKQGELVNPHVLTVQRKNIARLHTAINAAQSAEGEEK